MYNFDEIIERQGTNALNTDGFRDYIFHAGPEKTFPYKDDEFVRMWVADMEFATPDVIRDAIKERIDKKIFGYSMVYSDDYYQAFSKWCKEKYNWEFLKEELCFSPGIIPALYQLIEDLVGKDEKMLVMTPGYGYFKHAAEYNKVELVKSPLIETDGYFTIDFEDLEKRATDPKVKVLLWCNPHNPSGRMWTMEDLKKVAEIAKKNNLWLISDEIHCDLTDPGRGYIPFASVSDVCRDNSITCIAPTKTFNLAGLQTAAISVPNPVIRHKVWRGINTDEVAEPNAFAVDAAIAAFTKGADWLDALRAYIYENKQYAVQYVKEQIPEVEILPSEATYLLWIYCKDLPGNSREIAHRIRKKTGLFLSAGSGFSGDGDRFLRLNIACPRALLKDGMERLKRGVE